MQTITNLFKDYVYYPVIRTKNQVSNVFFDAKCRSERFLRGYARSDAWNLNSRIIEIVIPSLKQIRDEGMTHPIGVSEHRWRKILTDMIDGFEAKRDLYEINNVPQDEEERKQYFFERKKRGDRGLKLFAKYFDNLWD